MPEQVLPVTFPDKNGFRLFGILHLPERSVDDSAILLLSPGIKTRVAPHRLYKKMAEQFAALGYPVLRFDFYGLGDSEGENEETLLADLYGAIQVGRYIADTVAAMDWMQQNYGISKFVAAGLCGGAITGLLTAARDPRIISLLALAMPVIIDGSRIDATRYMTVGQLEGIRGGYLRKLTLRDPDFWRSWMRFVTFRSDYRLILRAIVNPLRATLRRDRPTDTAPPVAQEADNTNPHFAPALFRMLATSRRVLFIFAEADRLHWEFDAKFMNHHRPAVEQYAGCYEIHVTKQANHIFSLAEWQRDMMDRSARWLGREAVASAGTGSR